MKKASRFDTAYVYESRPRTTEWVVLSPDRKTIAVCESPHWARFITDLLNSRRLPE